MTDEVSHTTTPDERADASPDRRPDRGGQVIPFPSVSVSAGHTGTETDRVLDDAARQLVAAARLRHEREALHRAHRSRRAVRRVHRKMFSVVVLAVALESVGMSLPPGPGGLPGERPTIVSST